MSEKHDQSEFIDISDSQARELYNEVKRNGFAVIKTVCDEGFIKEKMLTEDDFSIRSRSPAICDSEGLATEDGYNTIKQHNHKFCSYLGTVEPEVKTTAEAADVVEQVLCET